MILEQGEPIINVHPEHKIKRNRRAGGTVSILAEPENKGIKYPSRDTECMTIRGSRCGKYRGGTGERAVLQPGPPWATIKIQAPLVSGPRVWASRRFAFAFCKTSKHFSGGIIWCYSKRIAIPYQQVAGKKHVRFHEGVPAGFNNSGEKPCLIILDDLLNDAYSKDVSNKFTKGSHHRNFSVILIIQNLLHHGKYCRDISLNAKYIVALKNVRDRDQLSHLARQVLAHESKGLLQAYLHDTVAFHGYL